MKNRLKVGIIGASGYSGEIIVKLLASHRQVDLVAVTSREHEGKRVETVIPTLQGYTSNLRFETSQPEAVAKRKEIDLWFLALPHGVASSFARPLFDAGRAIIDLSADFRLNSTERYREFYGALHPDASLLEQARYVIPELHPLESWKSSRLIASPGCYPTSILMPLVPLLREGLINSQNIIINSLSGVSGAGKKETLLYSYCERNESCLAYGAPKHRHLSEIEEQLSIAAEKSVIVQFTPHLVPMHRGILSTIIVSPEKSSNLQQVYNSWEKTYHQSPFVTVLPIGQFPDTRHVKSSNRINISAVYDERTGNYVITSALDNLLKGAGGQSVQIMNRWFGFTEEEGLL